MYHRNKKAAKHLLAQMPLLSRSFMFYDKSLFLCLFVFFFYIRKLSNLARWPFSHAAGLSMEQDVLRHQIFYEELHTTLRSSLISSTVMAIICGQSDSGVSSAHCHDCGGPGTMFFCPASMLRHTCETGVNETNPEC